MDLGHPKKAPLADRLIVRPSNYQGVHLVGAVMRWRRKMRRIYDRRRNDRGLNDSGLNDRRLNDSGQNDRRRNDSGQTADGRRPRWKTEGNRRPKEAPDRSLSAEAINIPTDIPPALKACPADRMCHFSLRPVTAVALRPLPVKRGPRLRSSRL